MRRLIILAIALLGMTCACELQPSTPHPLSPVETCAQVGQRCKLADNQLGVCGALDGGAQPGTLICQSQH